MPNNRNNRRRRSPLDTQAIHDLDEYDFNFCQYVDMAIPNKFRNTYVRQILDALDDAMEEALLGMTTDVNVFPAEKLGHIDNATGKLYFVSTRLNRLNDMQQISDDTKAGLDMRLYDIIDGLTRFSNSLRCKLGLAGQVPAGTPSGEAGGLEGCPTGQKS